MTEQGGWRELAPDLGKLNGTTLFFMLVPVLVVIPILAIYNLVWEPTIVWDSITKTLFPELSLWRSSLCILAAIICNAVAHEALHGFGWRIGKPPLPKGSIKIGFSWKNLTPYCHCNQTLSTARYLIGSLMPLIVLGLLPVVVGFTLGQLHWTIFGLFSITTVGGDLLVIYEIMRVEGVDEVRDHPTRLGCLVRTKGSV